MSIDNVESSRVFPVFTNDRLTPVPHLNHHDGLRIGALEECLRNSRFSASDISVAKTITDLGSVEVCDMRSFRLLAMLALPFSFLLFASGCVADFWAVDATRLAKTYELYDDRGIVLRKADSGKAFLIIEMDLTYIGDKRYPNADIRHDLDFFVTHPVNKFNFYEDEVWDFYDAIDTDFRIGDTKIGSIFFEIPDVIFNDCQLRVRAYEECTMCFQSMPVLEKELGEIEYVFDYPGSW